MSGRLLLLALALSSAGCPKDGGGRPKGEKLATYGVLPMPGRACDEVTVTTSSMNFETYRVGCNGTVAFEVAGKAPFEVHLPPMSDRSGPVVVEDQPGDLRRRVVELGQLAGDDPWRVRVGDDRFVAGDPGVDEARVFPFSGHRYVVLTVWDTSRSGIPSPFPFSDQRARDRFADNIAYCRPYADQVRIHAADPSRPVRERSLDVASRLRPPTWCSHTHENVWAVDLAGMDVDAIDVAVILGAREPRRFRVNLPTGGNYTVLNVIVGQYGAEP